MCLGNLSSLPRPRRMVNYLVKQGISVDCLCYNHPIGNSLCIEEYFFLKLRKGLFGISLCHRLIRHLPSLILSFSNKLFSCANFVNDWHLNVFKHELRIRKKSYDWIVVEDLKLLPLAFRVRGTSQILYSMLENITLDNLKIILCGRYLNYHTEIIYAKII